MRVHFLHRKNDLTSLYVFSVGRIINIIQQSHGLLAIANLFDTTLGLHMIQTAYSELVTR